mmetsp:Transcript_5667/g.12314  ORF Transcript_5667/g.12314 Transcript_5667/m.12314 type:complete len:107 (-) Transcript_5667:574-894(-)
MRQLARLAPGKHMGSGGISPALPTRMHGAMALLQVLLQALLAGSLSTLNYYTSRGLRVRARIVAPGNAVRRVCEMCPAIPALADWGTLQHRVVELRTHLAAPARPS